VPVSFLGEDALISNATKRNVYGYASALAGVLAVTALYKWVITDVNHTTVALSYLLVILLVASFHKLDSAILASVLALLCINFFFLPPIGTLTIEDPQNWIALFAFLITAIIASQLSSFARSRAGEAERRREELFKLYQLSQSIIITPDPQAIIPTLVRQIVSEFDVSFCALLMKSEEGEWHQLNVTSKSDDARWVKPDLRCLEESFTSGEIIAADLPTVTPANPEGPRIYYAPLKIGVKSIGVMLVAAALERGTIEPIAGLVALALERTAMLKELSHTEALKQSDELKSALLASVSHDLRTPLTSMRAAVDSLLEPQAEWDKAALHEFHVIISEEVQRLTRLVQNLLEMARIEAGELHLAKGWTAVSELISNTVDRCAEAIAKHRLILMAEESLPLVKVDSLLITQALTYVVENAAKYSAAGSEIKICGQVKGENLTISVEDHGVGIAPDETAHIFDKFYRSGANPVQQRPGTGMGLSIARGIIEAHGGSIAVESRLGQGSKFIFKIPVEVKEHSLEYSL
jgi:two-component system sensor histidine kinase KdpD